MSVPYDLQVLTERLAHTPSASLPSQLPALITHVTRCKKPLSTLWEKCKKDASSQETAAAVYKLKTQLNTLLNDGRSPPSRFVAAGLIKAVVESGGYECLQESEPWIRGLIQIIQKNNHYATKELSIITLTRIYTLLRDFPVLVSSLATNTIATFAKACLSLLESSEKSRCPERTVGIIAQSLATITPLYPTTLRPLTAQTKTAFRKYLAPTSSDAADLVPEHLRVAARRLLALQSYSAYKNFQDQDWNDNFATLIFAAHRTADLVFRAVVESWESNSGYIRQTVELDSQVSSQLYREPEKLPQQSWSGGPVYPIKAPERVPKTALISGLASWDGLNSGVERLIGLIETSAETLKMPTTVAVTIPVAALLDLTSRLTAISPPRSSSNQYDAPQMNPAIGKAEKAELWSLIPTVHISCLKVFQAMILRLGSGMLPVSSEITHQVTAIFTASHDLPVVRDLAYLVTSQLLLLCGPTMDARTVTSLGAIIRHCCDDILAAYDTNTNADNKPHASSRTQGRNNADAYLKPKDTTSLHPPLDPSKIPPIQPAADLLVLLPSHIPQRHLARPVRALIERTAVYSRNKAAMVACVLNVYVTKAGRPVPSILPFLARQYPMDQEVEVLRSHFRSDGGRRGGVVRDRDGVGEGGEREEKGEGDDEDDEMEGVVNGHAQSKFANGDSWRDLMSKTGGEESARQTGFGLRLAPNPKSEAAPIPPQPPQTQTHTQNQPSSAAHPIDESASLKRKIDELQAFSRKKPDTGTTPLPSRLPGVDDVEGAVISDVVPNPGLPGSQEGDSDSEGSVHLDGTLESDGDDSDEGEDE